MQEKKGSEAFEWYESIVFALALTITVLVFFFSFSRVMGSSMESTLIDGDQVLVRSFLYTPQRGDVITTDARIDYGKPLVKRVIALGGDTVEIGATGEVRVNGTLLVEPYLDAVQTAPGDWDYPIVVPQGKVFAMGDNRPHSLDSRSLAIGLIDEKDILGKVLLRVSPLSSAGKIA